jgi:hypothetical protein
VEGTAAVRDSFVRRLGQKEAEDLLDRTQRFVRSHPALAAILKSNAIGSRPDIVEAIASVVHSTGWR